MNFSEQHLLNSLPGRIEGWNTAIMALRADLSDPTLYARDAEKFAELSARLAEAQAAKAADEELWLVLELKREDVES
jgi:ATP-binding cassette subfamily F protein uup